VHELTVYCCFIFCCCCCFSCCRGLFVSFAEKSAKKDLLHHMQQAGALENFFTIMKCFWTTCEALYNVHHSAWLLKPLKLEISLPLSTKLRTATEQQFSAWMPKSCGNPGRVSF